MKTRRLTPKPKTHFQQVPIALVRKVAANVIVEPASAKTEPYSVRPVSAHRPVIRHR